MRPASRARLLPVVLLPVLLLLAVLLPAAPAAAHTALVGSQPSAGGALTAGATQVSLSFSGRVRAELSTVVVTGPDGADHARGPLVVRGAEVVQPLAGPLPAGDWTLLYRVVAADGHPLTGAVPFTVSATASTRSTPTPSGPAASPAAPAPEPAAPGSSAAATGGSSSWVLGGALAVAVVGGGVALGGLATRRQRR